MSMTTVIVGAGSGGATLAARLTEDSDQRVVLVEAGPDYEDVNNLPDDVRDAKEMSVEKHDWGLKAYFLEPPSARAAMPYARGRIVGGSSSVNAAIAQRATKEDLDTWVAAGNPEWSYEKTLPYFARLENDLDFPDGTGHGSSGPVPIVRHFEDNWPAITRAFAQSCAEQGFERVEDFNAKSSSGYGPVPRNLQGAEELRAGALLTYLATARRRPNLEIRADTLARRVLFEGTTAVGVEVERGGVIENIPADRVVLAGGAFHTPHLMMLSGIGPREVLETHGIDPVVVNEAVGQNLQDHPFSPMVALLKEKTDKGGVRAQLKYSTGTEDLVDDMMIFAAVLDPATMNIPAETKGKKALMMNNLLAKPHSVGWVTLASADPHVQPEIHVNFLSHPLDIERLKGSMRKSWEMINSSPMKEEIDEICFLDAETIADDDKLEDYIRSFASTSLHCAGTARMGPEGDPRAVVDQHLGVHGTENLWVADASVMVNVTTGLTNLTAFMIGERLADWLRDGPGSSDEQSALVGQAS
ncbi:MULTISPECIES: GMC family oxidoreductase [Citricoccus]|uniref:GMC family oxidoreductase n=1 Tax=Citricoccus TaxID=169133 RepID=UPI000255DFF4|nr:GMC family oxidoreductase N-terminal domain-containing protein [Citricoccus sp. CH26A]